AEDGIRARNVTGVQTCALPISAVDDVSLVVAAGTTTALLGPSGAGKSSLLAVAGGLTRPSQGTVALGDDVVFTPDTTVARSTREIGRASWRARREWRGGGGEPG